MKVLYLLTEGDFDSLVYEALAERLTSTSYSSVPFVMRPGSGLSALRANMKLALQHLARMTSDSGACFIIAMDNDRSPHAACSDTLSESDRSRLASADQRKQDRYAAILKALEDNLGRNHAKWRIPVAVAVPVEMIEAWLILITNTATAGALPRFSRQDNPSATHFYRPTQPPPQLKDLCDAAQRADGYDNQSEWALELISGRMDPADLAARSSSFQIFHDWLVRWPAPSANGAV